jgi:hypothetical protein
LYSGVCDAAREKAVVLFDENVERDEAQAAVNNIHKMAEHVPQPPTGARHPIFKSANAAAFAHCLRHL